MTKAFLVTVNDDLIKVKKLKNGKWSFVKIEKRADFSHFKDLQKYLQELDNLNKE